MAQHPSPIHERRHPGPRTYITVGIILAVLTALEVGIFLGEDALGWTSWLMAMILLVLSLAKFLFVVGYFMHLRSDDSRFSALFFFPFLIMVAIAIVLLAVFTNLTRG